MYYYHNHSISGEKLRLLTAAAFTLLLIMLAPAKVHAADTKGVTVLSSNNSLGAVFCTHNGSSFTHYTYAEPSDCISVSALPVNKNYQFVNWTDNGVIVSDSATYSFSVKDTNHVVIAHFDSKSEMKHKRYDSDKNISSITRGTNPCSFASGYKIDGMTINTALIPLDEASVSAIETAAGGHFLGAFQIQFTFGYDGTPKQSLDQNVRLVLSLPYVPSGTCRVTYVSSSGINIMDDLDTEINTVTFETKNSGIYVVTDSSNAAVPVPDAAVTTPAVPADTTITAIIPPAADTLPAAPENTVTAPATPADAVTAPAVPEIPHITQEQYQESVITILRYQLQQAGLTPAA